MSSLVAFMGLSIALPTAGVSSCNYLMFLSVFLLIVHLFLYNIRSLYCVILPLWFMDIPRCSKNGYKVVVVVIIVKPQ
jgi:hypothetical protein